jgi:hypothetical protein
MTTRCPDFGNKVPRKLLKDHTQCESGDDRWSTSLSPEMSVQEFNNGIFSDGGGVTVKILLCIYQLQVFIQQHSGLMGTR